MKNVTNTIRAHLWSILVAVLLRAEYDGVECISLIKMVKIRSRGFLD